MGDTKIRGYICGLWFVSGLSQRTDSEAYLTERSQRAMFPWIPCKRGSSPLAKGKDGLCCPGALVLNLFTPHHVH